MSKDLLELIGEILILIVLIKPMFELGILTGVGYILAIVGSFQKGLFFRKKGMARMIVVGTILTYGASIIIKDNLKFDNWLNFIIILILAVVIWIKGYLWKKGIKT